ncbi:MAG: transketolase C-terminal domain-containing protein, partial [Polaribacter sp.]|uniref:transketolase C-terminal domain-containing protein n=1 Tax=Polaribacter sp. TaxID=1920175 RepID=UPI003BB1115F
ILNFGALFVEAMKAGEELDATVVDMRWVKPLDEELILELASSHDLLITLEENAVAGGAGSAVAELLSRNDIPCPIKHFGLADCFIEHGDQSALRKESLVSADAIVTFIQNRPRISLKASANDTVVYHAS